MAYILYCDESSEKGVKYGDFFGGCMIDSADLFEVESALNRKKRDLNLNGEIKWTKVTSSYLEKYKEIMTLFFAFVREGKIKVRIMFRSISDVPTELGKRKVEDKYFKLYYQFIKHAFGLRDMPPSVLPARLIINLDVLPDNKGQRAKFKEYLCRLPSILPQEQLLITERNIIEVDSHNHVLLQCTDIVMGAMYFRLNDLHKAIPEGASRRGKKTIAKEKLYQHIYRNICDIHERFNIGVSTGSRGFENPHWESPYEHWKFVPK
ncbi:MAG: DUF3800 domain-containing protein [Butyricicoccus porcorum]